MPPVSYQSSSYSYHASARSRATSYGLTALIGGLILWMLIQLGIVPPILQTQPQQPLTVDLLPGQKPSPEKKKAPQPAPKATHGGGAPHRAATSKPTPAATPPTPKPPIPWNVIPLSSNEFSQSDIASKPTKSAAAPTTQSADNGSGTSQGSSHGATYGPSEDGGGESLMNAEWYVRPPRAALASYLRDTGVRTGYGEIACKTVPDFRVEDCHELGETPGSGFARAMREAAWQFRVRPPRVNGKPMIGAWVRIHYDMLPAGADDGR